MSEGAGDVNRFDRVPASALAVMVALHADGLVQWSSCQFEASGHAPERLVRAEERVVVGTVAHLLASDGILLVVKHEGGVANLLQ